ncbi:aspartic peptidase domain-containing protein [Colletotrichum godetiae]|uniref:Aspartic peptidase domain-containing protein n=1 Tax=Colletotrichum godetiae TaxID=1209918 RepID=A0AAJ0AMN0_9PEZI|nr:aspartic peptidase domain-containing protein [Colletotrichum godetiae]KAK1676698.1 aspartic peptidase domain-containing protein [Colletotrichum godetiae]
MEPSILPPHGSLAVLLILPAYLAALVLAACAPYPVPIRLGNVSLSNGQVVRGLELAVGEPEQKFAFIPQSGQNGTLLYGTNGVCTLRGSDRWSKDGCTSFRGGSYDLLASKTSKATTHDATPEDDGWPDINPVADTMKLNSNLTLDNLAMGIALSDWDTQGYKAMMGLGLGSNSTILRVLKESGKITSRTWSLFWGRGFGMSSQLDGHLIYGGYDRAKVSGKRYTQPLTPNIAQCESQLMVTVTDLTMNFDNGTDVGIFPSKSSAISTCINPTIPVMMRMPLNPYFSTFLKYTDNTIDNMTRSLGYHYWNMKYLPDQKPYVPLIPDLLAVLQAARVNFPSPHTDKTCANRYDGALTITLSSGLKIRVDRDNLVLPHVSLDEQTGEMLVNATEKDMLIDSMQNVNENDMAQLGWQFLSAAYLQVNHDTSEFSLWQANPTWNQDIVSIDPGNNDVTDFCSSQSKDGNKTVNGGGDAGGSGEGSSNDTSTSSGSPGLSRGATAGIAVGGAAAIAIIVGAVLWFLKRKRSRAPSLPSPGMMQNTAWTPVPPSQDLPSKTPPTCELDNGDTPTMRRYEMAG